ncbi:MAG: hypothetical protein IJT44_09480 [Clostridia bacterium]|nr:hypothetical protein [Clostridia bacterium]
MVKRIIGIILLVIGAMALAGGIINGMWAALPYEHPITAATEVILLLACLIGGVLLIVKSKKKK